MESERDTMTPQRDPKDLMATWLQQRPLETMLAVSLSWALSDGDRGDPDLLNAVLDEYHDALMDAVKHGTAELDAEGRIVLGAWMAAETLTGQ
ncbi:MAG: hypothetical protein JW741_12475 [Sedimentisphaerales bacterium]|nr:hypothetical protein [Sedimentisphaerales bacterium]